MKVEFEKNMTVMKTVSIFLVTAAKIYVDHAQDIGIDLPIRVFLLYTLYPVIYIFMYPLFKQVKKHRKKNEEYFKFVNDLNSLNFVLLGTFILVLITMEFWHKLGVLLGIIYLTLGTMLVISIGVFISMLISWSYLVFRERLY